MSNLNKNNFNNTINCSSLPQNNSHDEILKLERQFRNAYMLKSLEAQIAEKEANKIAKSVQDKLQIDLIAYQNRKAVENELKKISQLNTARRQCVQYLRKQIRNKEEIIEVEKKILQEERKILHEVDEISDKIQEEKKIHKREYLARKFKREKLLAEEIKEILKVEKIEEEILKAERDQKYEEKLKIREENMKINNSKKQEELILKVCRLLEEEMKEKKRKIEREEIIFELMAEEIKQELIVKENENLLLMREKKIKFGRELIAQMLDEVQLEEEAIKRENFLVKRVFEKVMEDDHFWRLTDEAKKRKQREYKEELAKFIEDARRAREEIVRRARDEFESEERIKRELRRGVEQERRRLIDLHGSYVVGYFDGFGRD